MTDKKIERLNEEDIAGFYKSIDNIMAVAYTLDVTINQLYDICKNHEFSITVKKEDFYNKQSFQRISSNDSNLEIIHYKEGTSHYDAKENDYTYDLERNFMYKIIKNDKNTTIYEQDSEKPFDGFDNFTKYSFNYLRLKEKSTRKEEFKLSDAIYFCRYIVKSILTAEPDLKSILNQRTNEINQITDFADEMFEKNNGLSYIMGLYQNNEDKFMGLFQNASDDFKEALLAEIYKQKNKNECIDKKICEMNSELVEKIGRLGVKENGKI